MGGSRNVQYTTTVRATRTWRCGRITWVHSHEFFCHYNEEAHRPFGCRFVCTCCFSAKVLATMENQISEMDIPLLPKIYAQFELSGSSLGVLSLDFSRFTHKTRKVTRKPNFKKRFSKMRAETPKPMSA